MSKSIRLLLGIALVIVCSTLGGCSKTDREMQEENPVAVEDETQTFAVEVIEEETIAKGATAGNVSDTTNIGVIGDVEPGLNINKGKIQEIPVLEFFDTTVNSQDKPIIVIEHGLTQYKEVYVEMALAYAKAGYYVVIPDLYLHGERKGKSDDTIIKIAVNSSKELDIIFNYYEDNEMINIDNIGLMGFSLGGMAVYHYLANGLRDVQAIAVVCSSPDWKGALDNYSTYCSYSDGELKTLTSGKYKETYLYVSYSSPYDKLLDCTDTSIYMINGEQDKVVSYQGNQDLYDALTGKGADVKLDIKPGLGHEYTYECMKAVYQYFNEKFMGK